MHPIQLEFERYIQAQEYNKADSLIESLLYNTQITRINRKDALSLLYRLGYVYPELTLELTKQRKDVPKPFIDTLNITLGNIPPLRFYKYADTLVALKIALIRKKPLIARFLINRFYKQFGLMPISLINKNCLTIGNNNKKMAKVFNTEKVSIIVTTYNSEHFIENCLNSLLNQSLSNIEIIVIDDASTDQTANIVSTYPEIKLVKLQENKGTYFARNIGVIHATGDFITFQDSDDWSHPKRCEYQLNELLNRPESVANFSYFFRVDETSGLPSCRQNYPLLRLNLSSMMIRSNVIKDLNGFQDDIRIESDSLFLDQLKNQFKAESIDYIKSPLAIGLLRHNSLTNSKETGFNRYGFSAHRKFF